MTLGELQAAVKDGTRKKETKFLLLKNREICEWLDVWLGMFLCKAVETTGFFQVRDFEDEPVVPID